MLRQIKLNAINEVIVKVQSFLFSIYKEENSVMSLTVVQINKELEKLTVAEIKNVGKLSAEEIVSTLG